jgi:hypothetical protein
MDHEGVQRFSHQDCERCGHALARTLRLTLKGDGARARLSADGRSLSSANVGAG